MKTELTEKYPESLVKDRTKIGQQCQLVHLTANGEVFLSMDNGVLLLSSDGNWIWTERD